MPESKESELFHLARKEVERLLALGVEDSFVIVRAVWSRFKHLPPETETATDA